MTSTWLEERRVPWCFLKDCGEFAKKETPFIINLGDPSNGGTHWTAARRIGKTLFYADPFGTVLNGYPPEELRHMGLRMVINKKAWQRPSTDLCGYYAYRFTKAMKNLREGDDEKAFEAALWKSIS